MIYGLKAFYRLVVIFCVGISSSWGSDQKCGDLNPMVHNYVLNGKDHFFSVLQKIYNICDLKVPSRWQDYSAWESPLLIHTERWQLHPTPFQGQKEKLLPLFESIGLHQDYCPQKKHYKHVLILGGASHRMASRVDFFVKWMPKITFDKIFFLTSDRPLDPVEESTLIRQAKEEGRILKTEADAAKYLWEYKMEDCPLPNKKIVFVVHPMIKERSKLQRPALQHTVRLWLSSQSPEQGSVLVFSNNPYILYQHLKLLLVLRSEGWDTKNYAPETVGFAEKDEELMSVYLDTIERIALCMKDYHFTAGKALSFVSLRK